jgi:hypothetical protein
MRTPRSARTLAQEIVDGACARSKLLCHRLGRFTGEWAEDGHSESIFRLRRRTAAALPTAKAEAIFAMQPPNIELMPAIHGVDPTLPCTCFVPDRGV